MNVLVVTAMYPHAARPASGAFVRQQVEDLRHLGHHVELIHIQGYRSSWRYLDGSLRVFARTLRGDFDVVHAHFGLTAVAAIPRWRTPLVVTLHGSDALGRRFLTLMTSIGCRFAVEVIPVSPQIAAKFSGTVIPCGIDLEQFCPRDQLAARRRLGLPPDVKIVLFPFDPGRSVKRYDLAQSAMTSLRRRGILAELHVLHGIEYDEMPWHYAAADTLLLCSDREGSPTVVKEAIACNLPVVATAVGDVPDLLHGVVPRAICSGSAEALAEGLAYVLSRPRPDNDASRSHAERFSGETAARAIEAVYQRAASVR